MTVATALKDNPFIRFCVDWLFARGDFVRPITQVPYIKAYVGSKPLGNVLDNGCGRGMYTPLLLHKATHYWGIDLGTDNIETMQRRYAKFKEKASFQAASATALPFADESFDFILFCEVLEHIPDHEKAVAEANRVLKPGGRMVLSVPVPPAPIDDKEHVREGYTLAELEALLTPYGFSIVRHQYCMYGISTAIIKFTSRFPAPFLPGLIKLPLYLETWFHIKPGTPYDIILDIHKPPSPGG